MSESVFTEQVLSEAFVGIAQHITNLRNAVLFLADKIDDSDSYQMGIYNRIVSILETEPED